MYTKTCVCCGKNTINHKYDICSICGWENDPVQNSDASFAGGANKLCLSDYRKKYEDNKNGWVAHYNVDVLEDTGLVKAFFTTTRNSAWKYEKEGSFDNCKSLSETISVPVERMVMLNQKHTDGVRVVTSAEAGEMVIKPISVDGNDGMITNEKGLLLGTVEADCVPIYILDTNKKAIGMVHSGWRGTAALIGVNAINKMIDEYGSNPSDIIVVIGPCICKDCYEVGSELIDQFKVNYNNEEINTFFIPRNEEKYSLDLRKAIAISLIKAGVNENNIHDLAICTYESDELCSWRRDNPVMRSMLTAIMLI